MGAAAGGRSASGPQKPPPPAAQLRVLTGVHGTDKVYCLSAQSPVQPPAAVEQTSAEGRAPVQPAAAGSSRTATSMVVFFVGDQLEAKVLPARVLELQVGCA